MSSKKLEKIPASEKSFKGKVWEWIKRYGPMEIAATGAAYVASSTAYKYTNNEELAAIAATNAGNLAFYGPRIILDIRDEYKKVRSEGKNFTRADFLNVLGRFAIEFGPAGGIDTVLTRPISNDLCTRAFGREIGVPVGQQIANITFFSMVIPLYEFLNREKTKA